MSTVEPADATGVTPRSECLALGQVIARIGDKWTVMVVGHLSGGPMRFNAIMRAIPGISHRMLTLTLRGLQRDGMVSRTVFPTIPPAVEYELTPLGRSLTGPLSLLAGWAGANRADIEAAQRDYDLDLAAVAPSRDGSRPAPG